MLIIRRSRSFLMMRSQVQISAYVYLIEIVICQQIRRRRRRSLVQVYAFSFWTDLSDMLFNQDVELNYLISNRHHQVRQ